MISSCTCKHAYQDKLYGKGMRVFNPMKDRSKARCSVCSTTKQVKTSDISKDTDKKKK